MSPQFDTNGDGCISLGELRAALKALLGERLSQREVDEILRDIDLNGDGLVDFEGTAHRSPRSAPRTLREFSQRKSLKRCVCARLCAKHTYLLCRLTIRRTWEEARLNPTRRRKSVLREARVLSKRSGWSQRLDPGSLPLPNRGKTRIK